MKPYRYLPWGALLILLVITAVVMAGPAAADDHGRDTEPTETPQTAVMAAMLADRLPVENRAPQTAIACENGMADTYPCQNVDLMSFLPLGQMGGGGGTDIWGWTDPQTGKEYAVMARTNGTSFIDITDAENPIYLGNLPTHTTSTTWRDVKVYANHAFVVSEASGHGMQIFDLTQLRSVSNPPQTFSNTAHYDGFGNAHNIVINEDSGFAYGVGAGSGSESGCAGGLHMVDITVPTTPRFEGCFSADGYTHDAQCIMYDGPDTPHNGREICFNANEDTLTIVDVEDKSNPTQLSREDYDGSGYSHQGWITEDHQYFLLDDELDESNNGHNTRTYIWDVRDLDAPVLIGVHTADVAAIDHNMYVLDGYLYQANYRAGLRIMSLENVADGQLSEEAYFDIYPSSNSANFNGAWSVYPYFESGNVIVSGIEQGLYVLRPALNPDFTLTAEPAEAAVCQGDDADYTTTLRSVYGFSEPVTLSVDGLPTGATADFGSGTLTPPNTTTLTIGSNGVAADNYMFDIVGTAASLVHTATVSLDVYTSTPPAAPAGLQPMDGDMDASFNPTLSWTAVPNAQTYAVAVYTENGSTPFYTQTVQTTEVTLFGLELGQTYRWEVTAGNPCTDGQTAVGTFTVQSNSLQSNGGIVAFENGLPLDWTAEDLINGGVIWVSTEDAACEYSNNRTGGGGEAACADSDALGSGSSDQPFDTALVSNPFDLPADSNARLSLKMFYYDNSSTDADAAVVEVWDGAQWDRLHTQDEGLFAHDLSLDLNAYEGMNDVQVRVRYYGDGWDYYTQIDDVQVTHDMVGTEPSAPQVTVQTPLTQTAAAGQTVTHTLRVTNTAATTDTMTMMVDAEWMTALSAETAVLDAGASTDLSVVVQVPMTATAGSSDAATVTVTAAGAPNQPQTVTVTTAMPSETEPSAPQVMVQTPLTQTAAAGQTVTHTLRVTNTAATTDTMTMMVDAEWMTALSAETAVLDAGASTDLSVVVQVPMTATAGSSDAATVTVTAAGAPNQPQTVTVTTAVPMDTRTYIYLPFIVR